ncbi:molecular chaperone HtpG [Pendulispora brunnea]|uniref:Chaperone protein HtpG n=1 Tax=Pendulispora brunnea TaxID=2905690 RepID=A0ABZ2KH90_9BACT
MTDPTPNQATTEGKKSLPFQAEVAQVLKLVIHSLYSHKEIFLRELVSNASDALDKLRFRNLTEPELMGNDPRLEITIAPDKEKGVLVIRDTGIGMTEAELIENLGTVAHSGSRAFLEQLSKAGTAKDVNLIGQFGVGFYSAYLVADRVEVITRAAGPGQRALLWSSDAQSTFTIEPTTRAERGTEIILHLRPEHKDFLDEWRIRDLVGRYSDYVAYPIKLEKKPEKDEKPEQPEQINRANALWQRPKSEITDAQYDELYKHLTHDFEPPIARTHFKVEGTQEFAGLLFIPRRPPFDLYDGRKPRGVRLFVKRVFIMDDVEEVLPPWLRFMRGVIDSDDLPLNVSRELLQDSTILHAIKKQVTKKTLDLLEEMAKERKDDYETVWKNFGQVLKEGLALDSEYKERIAPLLRYGSSHGEGLVSLADYVGRMKEGQEGIYYLFGESTASLQNSPYLETLTSRGFEVLFMSDPVDEWAAEGLREFQGKPLVSAMRTDLKLPLDEEQKKTKEEASTRLQPLILRMVKVLHDRVREVKVSDRLTNTPSCLVLPDGGTPAFMERLLKERGRGIPHAKRIFEINATHPIIESLASLVEKDAESPKIDEWIDILYDQALLTEGATIDDPNRLARRIASLLTEVATGGATKQG